MIVSTIVFAHICDYIGKCYKKAPQLLQENNLIQLTLEYF